MFNVRIVWENYNTMVYAVKASNTTEAIQRAIEAAPKHNGQVIHALVDQGYNVGY